MKMAAMEDDYEDAITIEGADEALSKVVKWLKTKLKDNIENEGSVDVLLQQQWRDGHKEVVEAFPFTFDREIDELGEEIVSSAVDDCEELKSKSQKYHVSATGVKGHVQFTLKCPGLEDADEDDIEEPSKKGLLMQTMRHQETTFKLAITDRSDVMAMLKDELHEARERIKFLESRSIENMKAYEDLISGKHARDLEIRKMENSETRKDMALSTLLQGAPILFGKLLGGPEGAAKMATSVPGGRTQFEMMVEGFLKTLDGQQFGKIVESNLFTPVQLAGLVEIAKFAMEREEAERKQAKEPAADGKQQTASSEPQAQETQETVAEPHA